MDPSRRTLEGVLTSAIDPTRRTLEGVLNSNRLCEELTTTPSPSPSQPLSNVDNIQAKSWPSSIPPANFLRNSTYQPIFNQDLVAAKIGLEKQSITETTISVNAEACANALHSASKAPAEDGADSGEEPVRSPCPPGPLVSSLENENPCSPPRMRTDDVEPPPTPHAPKKPTRTVKALPQGVGKTRRRLDFDI